MSEDLYWRLHALSKHMESSGRIDEHEYPSAYATILDAMNAVRAAPAQPALDEAIYALEWHWGNSHSNDYTDEPRKRDARALRGLKRLRDVAAPAQPAKPLPEPELPQPSLMVESAQGFVEGWTRSQVRSAINLALLKQRYAQPAEPVEMSPEFTDTARAALAWVLWHHQGGSSKVGQAMRFALGMGQHDRLTEHQVAEAKRWGGLSAPAQPAKHSPEFRRMWDESPVTDQVANIRLQDDADYAEAHPPQPAPAQPAEPMRDALAELESAEAHYRLIFQTAPTPGHLDVGRAWDRMKRAGDKARTALAAAPARATAESGSIWKAMNALIHGTPKPEGQPEAQPDWVSRRVAELEKERDAHLREDDA